MNHSQIKALLCALGFSESKENSSVFTKSFSLGKCEMKADFESGTLHYPAGVKIHDTTTSNFSQNENFVVFECVNRLLEKGYSPKHLELEPKWKVGHGASGGKADILVRDNYGKSLLIIECKTYGREFEDAWKDTLADGAQLFSYFQQDKDTQFVALYTSNFADGKINFTYKLIATKDNIEYLKSLKKGAPNFKDANSVKESFRVWAETYQKDAMEAGLFESDIAAYTIGKTKYSIGDLKEMDGENIQKKYHQFATILRQHNVSGHENAFDKLVNLFLAKIVDENTNKTELSFYWKGVAYDDVKSLIDRLQKLYKNGMKKFLGEDVTYIEKSQIDKTFKFLKNDPDAAKEKILDYFDQLKYYTNNDFAFIDVHNEKLFYQNAEVLLKMVKMLQDIKLQTETQNQFLGDLFEGFLDSGVKQSEGQFFTPMPIVKFLISSLPLAQKIKENEEPLKTIDYACGAGHFLNEYAAQILPILENEKKDKKAYYKEITGIEKEYRLSKVAKVSAFMYGQDEIEILYSDALARNAAIKDGSFDGLVANPPYSVKGFLETLDEDDLSRYELFNFVEDKAKKTNNSIETFFIERAKQLLRSGGVAAIILPSSVLSNNSIYIKAREIILKYFDLIAIAEFGSGTFGKTGTNTATLFLRKKDDNPPFHEHYKNRVNFWFAGNYTKGGAGSENQNDVYDDLGLLKKYCSHTGIDFEQYKTLLSGNPSAELLGTEIFAEYKKAFEKKKNKVDFSKFVQEIEKDKVYYFALCLLQENPVVIVRSPGDNKLMKDFLGYEWSSRKGAEGIKYIGAGGTNNEEDEIISQNKGISQIKTPLFNPADLTDNSKINSVIRQNFIDGKPTIKDELKPFVSLARLVDMLDFSRVDFDKQIKTTPEKKIEIVSKYELVKLSEIAEISRGASPRPISQYLTTNKNGVNWIKIGDVAVGEKYITQTQQKITIEGSTKSKIVKEGDFIISNSMSVGRPYILKISGCIHDGWLLMSNISEKLNKEFFYYVLTSEQIQEQFTANALGGVVQNLNTERVAGIKIPVPPLDIQQKIVDECAQLDKEFETSRMSIEEKKARIGEILEKESNYQKVKIGDVCEYSSDRVDCEILTPQNYIGVDNLLQNTEGKIDSDFVLTSGTATAYRAGDILLSNIRPYLKKIWFADNDGGSSNDVLVLKTKSVDANPQYLFYNLKQDRFFDYEMQKVKGMKMPRGDKNHILDYTIPLPPLSRQKEIVSQIEKLEADISAAQAVIAAVPAKKRAVLERWLK